MHEEVITIYKLLQFLEDDYKNLNATMSTDVETAQELFANMKKAENEQLERLRARVQQIKNFERALFSFTLDYEDDSSFKGLSDLMKRKLNTMISKLNDEGAAEASALFKQMRSDYADKIDTLMVSLKRAVSRYFELYDQLTKLNERIEEAAYVIETDQPQLGPHLQKVYDLRQYIWYLNEDVSARMRKTKDVLNKIERKPGRLIKLDNGLSI